MFCEINDLAIPWKKISRGLPRGRRYADDRAPTIEEIRRILKYPDRRIKPIVLTVSSCGFRLGSWDYLRWRNVHPIMRGNQVIAAKLVVYGGDDDEASGFPKEEIMILSTYGQRETNVVNLDGSRHIHLFNFKKYLWNTNADGWVVPTTDDRARATQSIL